MADVLERVEIEVDGRLVANFADFTWTAGAERAVRTATCRLAGPVAEADFPLPDMPVVIRTNGETILTGIVRDADPEHSDSDGGEIWTATVTFASKTVDATESSALHPTGEIRRKKLDELANAIEGTNVEWKAVGEMPEIPLHRLALGRSSFREVEEIARARGLLIYDNPDGDLQIVDGPQGRHAGGVVLGVNIMAASGSLSGETRKGPAIVRGQTGIGSGNAAFFSEARAENPELDRPRPQVILFENEPTRTALADRAQQEITRREGRGRSASVTVPGWRDQAGELWQPNRLVFLDDPLIFLSQDMLVQSVTFSQPSEGGGRGTHAVLSLVDPRAMNGEDPKASNDGRGYGVKKPKATVKAEPPPEGPLEPV